MSGFRESIDPFVQDLLPRNPQTFINKPSFNALDESIPIVDRILEPQTMGRFIEFAISGKSPTGNTTKLPLLPPELINDYLMAPYTNWAPGPHDIFNTSPFDHAMVRIGSHQDSDRLVLLEKGVHAMKSRLWEGILPMTENRWRQKKLDDPYYHRQAVRHLGQVIEVFAYLQHPPILTKLTETYRLIYAHFTDFDKVVNGLPQRAGQAPIGLAALWEEFLTAHYTAITTYAHSWMLSKISALRSRDEALILTINPPDESIQPSQMDILNRIQDLGELALRATYTIFIHMPNSDPPVPKMVPSLESRRHKAANEVKSKDRLKAIQDTLASFETGVNLEPMNSPTRLQRSIRSQAESQDEVRIMLRGRPMTLPPVNWMVKLKEKLERRENKNWGFVAYRLTYNQSDEEWATFLKKLEADMNDWGEGESNVEDLKITAKLEWYDGKELGIAEGDIGGAKKHFSSTREDNSGGTWESSVFLVVDFSSYTSYTCGSPFSSVLLPGDTGGFVTAVDIDFDTNNSGEHAEESPHYPGQLRVLGNLLYPDLYAMLAAETQGPEELWPLAMNHPELVYTGPTVKAQVDLWKKATKWKISMLDILSQWVKTQSANRTT